MKAEANRLEAMFVHGFTVWVVILAGYMSVAVFLPPEENVGLAVVQAHVHLTIFGGILLAAAVWYTAGRVHMHVLERRSKAPSEAVAQRRFLFRIVPVLAVEAFVFGMVGPIATIFYRWLAYSWHDALSIVDDFATVWRGSGVRWVSQARGGVGLAGLVLTLVLPGLLLLASAVFIAVKIEKYTYGPAVKRRYPDLDVVQRAGQGSRLGVHRSWACLIGLFAGLWLLSLLTDW